MYSAFSDLSVSMFLLSLCGDLSKASLPTETVKLSTFETDLLTISQASADSEIPSSFLISKTQAKQFRIQHLNSLCSTVCPTDNLQTRIDANLEEVGLTSPTSLTSEPQSSSILSITESAQVNEVSGFDGVLNLINQSGLNSGSASLDS
ncbi:unnamed protein product, partial [Protopolystoma xenopodis]